MKAGRAVTGRVMCHVTLGKRQCSGRWMWCTLFLYMNVYVMVAIILQAVCFIWSLFKCMLDFYLCSQNNTNWQNQTFPSPAEPFNNLDYSSNSQNNTNIVSCDRPDLTERQEPLRLELLSTQRQHGPVGKAGGLRSGFGVYIQYVV